MWLDFPRSRRHPARVAGDDLVLLRRLVSHAILSTSDRRLAFFQPSDAALMGSKLACQAPLRLTEGDFQPCAVEKDAYCVANLTWCVV
jgi:hypothetical protein